MPKKNFFSAPQIEPGDAGIWVTCDMHMEGLCTVELKDFFNEVHGHKSSTQPTSHRLD